MLRIILLIVSVVLIILSLLQSGKADGLSALTGGSDLGLFDNIKERGPEKFISRLTLVLGICFFVIAIVIQVIK